MHLFKFTLICCFLVQCSFGALLAEEQTILVDWYNSLTSTGTLGWNVAVDLCFQTGVYCTSTNPQNVQYLILTGLALEGTIPTQFGSLGSLQYLLLTQNSLTGTIPSQLEDLTNLQYLELGLNMLTGEIPPQLGSLSNLQALGLEMNKLTGTLPTQLCDLPNLQQLYLYGNQLTGPIPSQLVDLPNLQQAYLSQNNWDCPITNYSSISTNDYDIAEAQCDTTFEMTFYAFSKTNKSLDASETGHDLISFKTESMNYPLDTPDNDALIFFGPDVIYTSSPSYNLTNSFSIFVLFSISKFYGTTDLVLFTKTDRSEIPSLNLMVYSSGSIQVSLNGVVVLRTANSVISLNTPYLISLTKDGNVMRIFVNGQPIKTIINAPSVDITNNVMYLGYNFVGIFDKVAIYSSALTQIDISNQLSGLSLPTSPCGGCMNGGICGKIGQGKKCFCPQCFTGPLCQTRIKGCQNPCKNGGVNVNGVCQCAAGFTGPTCTSTMKCPGFNDATGNFLEGTAYKARSGKCPAGKTGNPRRYCLHDGSWGVVSSPCK